MSSAEDVSKSEKMQREATPWCNSMTTMKKAYDALDWLLLAEFFHAQLEHRYQHSNTEKITKPNT